MKVLFLLVAVFALSNSVYGKIFTKCELAKKLSKTFPRDKLPDWNCLVKHESSYNSGKRGPKNKNGSYDYGIFQINDKYWCKVGSAGGDCNIDCNSA
jgi:C-type lysozyme/alpha-lactalbumin family